MSHLRRTVSRPAAVWLTFGLLAAAAGAWAASSGLFHVGNFRRMMHTGDTAGQKALAQVPQQAGTWGVGATGGLKGEIVQIDGRVLVSPGDDSQGRVRPPAADETAVLFASAQVSAWVDVPVPVDMDAVTFEAFVHQQAATQGLPADRPFAFRVEGRFPRLRWHVVTGDAPAGAQGGAHGGASHGAAGAAGHGNARSGMKVFYASGAQGQLIGIYSGAALEGVVSHPGERFHLHYVDSGATVSGHVDAYGVAAGSVLKLPRP
jgi:alpha-acetolactate decarboxylase